MADRRVRVGFRMRVLGTFVALLVGAMALGLLGQRAVLHARLDRSVADGLEQERAELQRLAGGTDPQTGQPFGSDVAAIFDTFLRRNLPEEGEVLVTFVDGQHHASTPAPHPLEEDAALVERWTSLTTGEWGDVDTPAGPVRYLAVPLRDDTATRGVFVVARFVQADREEIDSTLRIEALVTGVVLLLASAIAWWTAGRLLRPVRSLTEAAESISDTDIDRRIPVEGDDEIARLARRFNEMLDRLAASFAAQRAFVDDAGHELRTPITIVRGHLQVMGDDPEDRRRTIALVTAELDRMARIVEDLLVLAKAEQPDFLRIDDVEVADLTTELLVKARALGDRPWGLDACASGMVRADAQRVTQAVLNLARNALEHTPPGTEVAMGSQWRTDGLRIWVRDEGPGIPLEDQPHLFERFRRGRSAGARSEGAGLGLAIARSVAEGHGGRLELDSRPGAGTTFSLVLPGLPPPPDELDDPAGDEGYEAIDVAPGEVPDQHHDLARPGEPPPPSSTAPTQRVVEITAPLPEEGS